MPGNSSHSPGESATERCFDPKAREDTGRTRAESIASPIWPATTMAFTRGCRCSLVRHPVYVRKECQCGGRATHARLPACAQGRSCTNSSISSSTVFTGPMPFRRDSSRAG